MHKLTASIIGLGSINMTDHLPALLDSEYVVLDSVCDTDQEKVEQYAKEYSVEGFDSVDDLIAKRRPDFALIALPHNEYEPIVDKLAHANIHILKEKPFATNLEEAIRIDSIVRETGIKMLVTLQRRYNPIFRTFEQLRSKIGRVFYFNSQYTLNVKDLANGWRAEKEKAGGGCLIDMGYHSIDLLVWYFGLPKSVQAHLSRLNREDQRYDVEDTCSMILDYGDQTGDGTRLFGNMLLSRVFPKKQEKLTVLGTRGAVEIERMRAARLDNDGQVQEELTRSGEWHSAFIDQIVTFAKWIRGAIPAIDPAYTDHFKHVAIIEAAYLSDERHAHVNPAQLLSSHHINV